MSKKVSQVLLSLSDTDRKIYSVVTAKGKIEEQKADRDADLEAMRRALSTYRGELDGYESQRTEEASRLKGEEERLVEQRKQLTALSGAKQAKLVERQIDVASRSLKIIEERSQRASEQIISLEQQIEELQAECLEKEAAYSGNNAADEEKIAELHKEITALSKERESAIAKLDDRLQRLYRRVNMRYPDSAIATAKRGSCRSCFRALPPQTFNQIMSGNSLIQCPGCGRILVFVADETVAQGKSKHA